MSLVYILQLFILLCMKVFTKLRKVLRRSGCKTCWCSSSWIFYYITELFLPIAVEYHLSVYWLWSVTVQFYYEKKIYEREIHGGVWPFLQGQNGKKIMITNLKAGRQIGNCWVILQKVRKGWKFMFQIPCW